MIVLLVLRGNETSWTSWSWYFYSPSKTITWQTLSCPFVRQVNSHVVAAGTLKVQYLWKKKKKNKKKKKIKKHQRRKMYRYYAKNTRLSGHWPCWHSLIKYGGFNFRFTVKTCFKMIEQAFQVLVVKADFEGFRLECKYRRTSNGSDTNGSFTMANSNSFLCPYEILPIAPENKFSTHNIQFHDQYTVILQKSENTSLNYRYLLPDLALWLTLSGSSYPYLEQISMVPKMFEPLKFDCSRKTRKIVPSGGNCNGTPSDTWTCSIVSFIIPWLVLDGLVV